MVQGFSGSWLRLLLPDAPALLAKAVELALQGDTVMLRACLDKFVPNARGQSRVSLEVADSASEQGRALLGKVCEGELSVEDGKALMGLLAVQARLEEQDELARRIAALEEANGLH